MAEQENLEALAEDIRAGRDTIAVPEKLLVDATLEQQAAPGE
jgi:hypothetical protein